MIGGMEDAITLFFNANRLVATAADETWLNGATIGKDTKSGNHLLAGAVRIMRVPSMAVITIIITRFHTCR